MLSIVLVLSAIIIKYKNPACCTSVNAKISCKKKQVTVVVKLIYQPDKECDCAQEWGDLGEDNCFTIVLI